MNIDIKRENGILLIKPLDKSIEALNSRDFKSKVGDLIDQENKIILLNLSEVEFMDSSGLGAVISILKTLANSEGKIAICEAQNQVTRLFELTRLNQIFQIFSTEKEAANFLNLLTPQL